MNEGCKHRLIHAFKIGEKMASAISRKFSIGILFAAVLMALFMIAILPNSAFAVKASNGAKAFELRENVTYSQYDVTGDKKADKIKIVASYKNNYVGEKISIIINGKTAFSKKTFFFSMKTQLIKLKNGKCFMYLYGPTDNGDAEICALYQVKGSKLKRIVDFNKGFGTKAGNHVGGEVLNVSGNSATLRFRVMAYMSGNTYADYSYRYKSGTLKKISKTGKLKVGEYTGKSSFAAKKNIIAYKSTKCTSKKFTIKKGQKVKFLKVYVKGNTVRYYVKANGKSGWIKVANSYKSALMHKYMYMPGFYLYEPPFEGLMLAG